MCAILYGMGTSFPKPYMFINPVVYSRERGVALGDQRMPLSSSLAIGKEDGVLLRDWAPWNCWIPGDNAWDHGFFLSAGNHPEDAATAIDDRIRQGHAAAVLVEAGEGDFGIMDIADWIAWDE